MNREIKFRIWNGKDLNYNPIFSRDWTNNINKQLNERINEQGLILQQYTGLKDKNGKEIFEGDILLDKEKGQKERAVGFVEYQAYQFVIRKLPKTKRKTWYEMWGCCVGEEGKHLEVIGNIYENPELLK